MPALPSPGRVLALALALALLVGGAGSALAEPRAVFLAASDTAMENPHDIKLSPDGRELFVSDVGNNRVLVLDAETLAPLWSFGADHQAGTHDVDFDADGRIYVADTHNNRATIYEREVQSARLVGELSAGVRGVEGVLAHPNGTIYVGGAWSDNVVAFRDRRAVAELGGLEAPHDLELAPSGDIWLADSGNDRMLLLSPALEILKELKGPPWNFRGVRYQDVAPDGTLVVADKNNHQVKVIGPDGALLLTIGAGPGRGPGVFRTPEGVELDGERLYVSDSGNDRIVVYRLTLD